MNFYLINLLIYAAVDAMACLGLSQQFGVAGVTNFGFIIFQAAGGYTAAILAMPHDTANGGFQSYIGGWGLPFPLPWIGAAVVGGVIALPFTFLVGRRLRGDFAAVGLLVTAVLLNLLVTNYRPLLNGDAGLSIIPAPLQGEFNPQSAGYEWGFAAVGLALALGVYLFLRRITESPYGRSLRAMRDNDLVADSLGKNLLSLRTAMLVLGGAIAGLSGGILVSYISTWSPAAWGYAETVVLFAAVIIGGAGNHRGAILGAILVPVGFEEVTRFIPTSNNLPPNLIPSLQWVAIGLLIVVFLWLRPQGIFPERKRVIGLVGAAPAGRAGAWGWRRWARAEEARPETPVADNDGWQRDAQRPPHQPAPSAGETGSGDDDGAPLQAALGGAEKGPEGDGRTDASGAPRPPSPSAIAADNPSPPKATARRGAPPSSTSPSALADGGVVLEAVGVGRVFGGMRAVDDVSFQVHQGTLTGLIGPNGAGKSTLLAMLAGTLPVSSGRVVYRGQDITGMPAFRRARLGLVRTFQLASEFKRLTVLENLLSAVPVNRGDSFRGAVLGKRYWKDDESAAIERATVILERFGLEKFANHYAGDLSGGQRRLVEIMRSLMAEPGMLLLDEPMAGVHPHLARRIGNELLALCSEGMTILMVEHELAIMDEFCDPVVVMAEGAVLAEGTMEQLRGRSEVVEAYLVG
ncbi:MAG: branched-chain amino acid transport system permease protein [Streptosporangiaceae bacterium]|jgi:branched-chain amino acid transport system permease protein|nr:branched-chain amino acid transport system permease protein [Streptosporangiaceae bacterium]